MIPKVMDRAVLLDSNVVIHALGGESPWRDACQDFLSRADGGEFRLYASVEMVQEVVHHRLRRTADPARSAFQGRTTSAICTTLPFDREVLDLSLDLIEAGHVRGRDAVHAATALAYGIERVASIDSAFDQVPGLRRLDPVSLPRLAG